jgi:hypothetical protein
MEMLSPIIWILDNNFSIQQLTDFLYSINDIVLCFYRDLYVAHWWLQECIASKLQDCVTAAIFIVVYSKLQECVTTSIFIVAVDTNHHQPSMHSLYVYCMGKTQGLATRIELHKKRKLRVISFNWLWWNMAIWIIGFESPGPHAC